MGGKVQVLKFHKNSCLPGLHINCASKVQEKAIRAHEYLVGIKYTLHFDITITEPILSLVKF